LATIRNEVLAFALAAQDLLTREAKKPDEPLSDHETDKIGDCLARLEQAILESNLSRSDDGKVSTSEGDGHGDGHSPDGDGHL
jgi:hypothetical protein